MTAICPKCGRDCRTALALGKHEAKGCGEPVGTVTIQGSEIPVYAGETEKVVLTPENHNPEDWKPIDGHDGTATEIAVMSGLNDPRLLRAWPWKDTCKFSDRHQTKTEKCPKCCEIWADFLILDENTWVCLSCGCHFMPREKLNQINDWKLKDAERRRTPQTA